VTGGGPLHFRDEERKAAGRVLKSRTAQLLVTRFCRTSQQLDLIDYAQPGSLGGDLKMFCDFDRNLVRRGATRPRPANCDFADYVLSSTTTKVSGSSDDAVEKEFFRRVLFLTPAVKTTYAKRLDDLNAVAVPAALPGSMRSPGKNTGRSDVSGISHRGNGGTNGGRKTIST